MIANKSSTPLTLYALAVHAEDMFELQDWQPRTLIEELCEAISHFERRAVWQRLPLSRIVNANVFFDE